MNQTTNRIIMSIMHIVKGIVVESHILRCKYAYLEAKPIIIYFGHKIDMLVTLLFPCPSKYFILC